MHISIPGIPGILGPHYDEGIPKGSRISASGINY